MVNGTSWFDVERFYVYVGFSVSHKTCCFLCCEGQCCFWAKGKARNSNQATIPFTCSSKFAAAIVLQCAEFADCRSVFWVELLPDLFQRRIECYPFRVSTL